MVVSLHLHLPSPSEGVWTLSLVSSSNPTNVNVRKTMYNDPNKIIQTIFFKLRLYTDLSTISVIFFISFRTRHTQLSFQAI